MKRFARRFPSLSTLRTFLIGRVSVTSISLSACAMICGPLAAQTGAQPAMKAASSVALTMTNNAGSLVSSVPAGAAVTLTASVTGGSNRLFHGLVRFCDTAVAPRCTFENKVGEASLTKLGTASVKLTPGDGAHSYTAVFYPQLFFATATSAADALTVTTAGTSTTAIVQTGTVGNYMLTATVATKGGSALPTGTVSFLDASQNNKVLGTATLVNSAPANSANALTGLLGSGLSSGLGSALGGGGMLSLAAGVNPGLGSVVTGDFNHDGKLDFAVIGSNDYAVTINLGNGDGTFTAAPSAPIANNGVYQMKVADFNQDGNQDIILVNQYNNELDFLMGNGDGTFRAGTSIMAGGGPTGVTVGDFNGDGILDLIRANTYGGTETFLAGNGDGTFTSGWQYYTSNNPQVTVSGDFNGDGIQDFAVVLETSNAVQIFTGNGDGTFNPGAMLVTGNLPLYAMTGDFNGDGKVDLAVTNSKDNTVSVFLGAGDATFTLKQTVATPAGTADVVAGNLNGDGVLDLVVSSSTAGVVTLLTGNGDGTFTTSVSGAAGVAPYQIALGDFNGDGLLDVVAAGNLNTATVLLTQAPVKAATATLTGVQVVGTGAHNVVASYSGDLNFGASVSSATTLTGRAMNAVMVLYPSSIIVSQGQQVALTSVLSPYANGAATANGETVTYYVDGKVIGTAKLNSGSATLNTTSIAAGLHVLTSSYAGDAMFTPANGVNLILVFPKW